MMGVFACVSLTPSESVVAPYAYTYVVLNAVLVIHAAWGIVRLLKAPSGLVEILGCGQHSAFKPTEPSVNSRSKVLQVAEDTAAQSTGTATVDRTEVIDLSTREAILEGMRSE
jgi:hypothetical protein